MESKKIMDSLFELKFPPQVLSAVSSNTMMHFFPHPRQDFDYPLQQVIYNLILLWVPPPPLNMWHNKQGRKLTGVMISVCLRSNLMGFWLLLFHVIFVVQVFISSIKITSRWHCYFSFFSSFLWNRKAVCIRHQDVT